MKTTSAVDQILTSISYLPTAQSTLSHPSPSTGADPGHSNDLLKHLPLSATRAAKSLFLTLHFLFPHELLPALDILDRGLVTKFIIAKTNISAHTYDFSPNTTALPANKGTDSNVFYIQSASALTDTTSSRFRSETPGRFRNAFSNPGADIGTGTSKDKSNPGATQTWYEVRLDSWNCSCAAFAYSSFTALLKEEEDTAAHAGGMERNESDIGLGQGSEGKVGWRFGGMAARADAGVPVCKHILAAVMARAAPGLFADGLRVKIVEREEMAGWGAGWGD